MRDKYPLIATTCDDKLTPTLRYLLVKTFVRYAVVKMSEILVVSEIKLNSSLKNEDKTSKHSQ